MTQVNSEMMDDMDPQLLAFLQTKVNSFIKWDLVRFFHNNPHAADTAENIARYIGRDDYVIEDDLTGLVESGILQSAEVPNTRIYSLVNDSDVRAMVANFVAACSDRQFRVKAIYQVIRAMR